MHYDEDVVRDVTDPVRGLPGVLKWLPAVAEVRQACEDRLKPMREAMAREKREGDTRLLLTPPTASAEERERGVERWVRDMRPQFAEKQRKRELSMDEVEKTLAAWEINPPVLPAISEYARMTKRERAERILGANDCGND
jgi:hypothetical protein